MARAFEPLSKAVVKQIAELGINKIRVVDTGIDDGIIIKCLKKDPTKDEDEALKDIYRRLRPGDPPTAANARALIKRLFFDPKRYDLGAVVTALKLEASGRPRRGGLAQSPRPRLQANVGPSTPRIGGYRSLPQAPR